MRKGRIVIVSLAAILAVAAASVTPPYSTLWDALQQRHLEPSGQARWQIQERQQKADEERRLKREEEKRRLAEIRAEEERQERERLEKAGRARDLEAKRVQRDEARKEMASIAQELSSLAARKETLANAGQGKGTAAFAQMRQIEQGLDSFLEATARQVDLTIARIMAGEACRRSSGPESLFDEPIDTIYYIVLCAYQQAHQDGDLITRADLILFLNRSSDHKTNGLNRQRIPLADLMRHLWFDRLSETDRDVDFRGQPMEAVRKLFKSDAPSFVKTAILDTLTVTELEALRQLVSDLRAYQDLRGQLQNACWRYAGKKESAERLEEEVNLIAEDDPQEDPQMQSWRLANTSSAGDPAEYDWQAKVSRKLNGAGSPDQLCGAQ